MKKKRDQLYENTSNLETTISSAEATGKTARIAKSLCSRKKGTIVEGTFVSAAKNPTRQETREYRIEARIQNKKRFDKCDAYTAKEILGYRGRKLYMAVARGAAKTEENQRGTRGETNQQKNNQSSLMRRREEPMEEQISK